MDYLTESACISTSCFGFDRRFISRKSLEYYWHFGATGRRLHRSQQPPFSARQFSDMFRACCRTAFASRILEIFGKQLFNPKWGRLIKQIFTLHVQYLQPLLLRNLFLYHFTPLDHFNIPQLPALGFPMHLDDCSSRVHGRKKGAAKQNMNLETRDFPKHRVFPEILVFFREPAVFLGSGRTRYTYQTNLWELCHLLP